jgi:hypothetical protein
MIERGGMIFTDIDYLDFFLFNSVVTCHLFLLLSS